MKKLFVLLAAVGVFASCSKEAPVLPATDKVQGTTSAHSGDKADRITIGMDMSGVLEEFEQVIGSLDAPQEARSISTPINTAAKGTRLIDYKPEFVENAPGSKEKVLHALGIIYDKKTGTTVDVIMDFKSHGNNGMIAKGKVKVLSAGLSSQLAWEALEKSKMKDAYISIYIGVDGSGYQLSHRFTNKGAYLIKNGDDGDKLPKNFVVLKSLENKLDWEEGSEYPVIIKDRKIAKFSLQGYLLGIRFRNAFPEKVLKHTWAAAGAPPRATSQLVNRPPLDLKFRLQGLSAATNSAVDYDHTEKAVVFKSTTEPTVGFNKLAYGYYEVKIQNSGTNLSNHPDLGIKADEVIRVPVEDRSKDVLAPGEEFLLIYCPDPLDQGRIAFEPDNEAFYDGTVFSLASANPKKYYTLEGIKNVIAKVKGQGGYGPATRQAVSTDGKIYLQMFDIDPGAGKPGAATLGKTTLEKNALFKDYSQRLKNLK